MRKNLVNDLLVFDTMVRRIGDDLCGATAMSAGFYRAAIGSMSPKAPTFGVPGLLPWIMEIPVEIPGTRNLIISPHFRPRLLFL